MSDASESEASCSSFQADFDRLATMLQTFAEEIESLAGNLEHMQKPMENIEYTQLVDPRTLETSSFRGKTFQMKISLAGIDAKKRYPFHFICANLRNYLFRNDMVLADGTLRLDNTLKQLFSVEEPVTYLDLLGRLHTIVA